MFTAALFTIAKMWKQPKCLWMDERIKKVWHTHTGILFILKKEENTAAICNSADNP